MSRHRHTVAVIAFDAVQLLDVSGPVEVFTTANRYGAHYDVRVVSPTGAGVVTSSGLVLGVNGSVPRCPAGSAPCWSRGGGTGGRPSATRTWWSRSGT